MRRGRKEKELVCSGGPAASFANALREARRQAGNPTYREMADTVHYSGPALSQAASGSKLPTWPVTAAYLKACGINDLAPWQNDWNIAQIENRLARAKSGTSNAIYPIHRRTAPAPAPSKPGTVHSPREQLLDILNALGKAKGLSLRAIASRVRTCQQQLAEQGGPAHTPSLTTISDVLSGKRPITNDFVTIYLNAVDATPDEQRTVGEAIGRLEFKLANAEGPSSLLARGTAKVPAARAVGRACIPAPRKRTSAAPPSRKQLRHSNAEPAATLSVHNGLTPGKARITAAVLDDPIADSFILRTASTQHRQQPWPGHSSTISVLRTTDLRIRCHRRATGYHTPALRKKKTNELRKTTLPPELVAGGTIFSGLACWAVAFATSAAGPAVSLANLGSAVLVASGAAMLIIVLLLLNTVLRDDTEARRKHQTWPLRRHFYRGRHHRKAAWTKKIQFNTSAMDLSRLLHGLKIQAGKAHVPAQVSLHQVTTAARNGAALGFTRVLSAAARTSAAAKAAAVASTGAAAIAILMVPQPLHGNPSTQPRFVVQCSDPNDPCTRSGQRKQPLDTGISPFDEDTAFLDDPTEPDTPRTTVPSCRGTAATWALANALHPGEIVHSLSEVEQCLPTG